MSPSENRGLKAWGYYVGGSAVLLGLAGGLAWPWLGDPARAGLWIGLALALAIQALAFAAFLCLSDRSPRIIVAGWAVGTFLRLMSLAVFGAFLLPGGGPVAGESTLVAMGGGMLVMLWLEPLAFRWRLETS